ncbi:MAG: type II secretion system F family protein [Sedimentisphaerales bacterium]|nr:type II secretion system F family protein [Sedimentisphaerales bacterium]
MVQTTVKTNKNSQAQNDNRDMRSSKSIFDELGLAQAVNAGKAGTSYEKKLANIKIKQSDLIMFTIQLSVMLDSGVVLSDALDAIAEQQEYGPFRQMTESASTTVKSGEPFSRALMSYPRTFTPMYISMVKASEASGKMVEMLRVLSSYLEFEVETKKKIKGALTYPFIMALMAVAATGTLMFFVLPRFTKIYQARGAALPKITQILVGFSSKLADFEIMTAVVTALIVIGVALYYFARTETGRRITDYLKINIPIVGTMFIDTVVARSMRIMSTMVNTGVNLLDTVRVIQDSCRNFYFQRLWSEVDDKIRDGYQFSESIQLAQDSTLISSGIIQMLKAGEKSGKLGQVSDKISLFYEKKLHASIKAVMTLIEPLMITILGAIIGTIAIALLLPVFRISSVISH